MKSFLLFLLLLSVAVEHSLGYAQEMAEDTRALRGNGKDKKKGDKTRPQGLRPDRTPPRPDAPDKPSRERIACASSADCGVNGYCHLFGPTKRLGKCTCNPSADAANSGCETSEICFKPTPYGDKKNPRPRCTCDLVLQTGCKTGKSCVMNQDGIPECQKDNAQGARNGGNADKKDKPKRSGGGNADAAGADGNKGKDKKCDPSAAVSECDAGQMCFTKPPKAGSTSTKVRAKCTCDPEGGTGCPTGRTCALDDKGIPRCKKPASGTAPNKAGPNKKEKKKANSKPRNA